MKEIEDFEIGCYEFVPKPFSKKFNSYEEAVEFTGIDWRASDDVMISEWNIEKLAFLEH